MGKTPWADRERRRFRKRGGKVLAGLATYISEIEACGGDADLPAVMKAGERLRAGLLKFADAQFDFVGTANPFGGPMNRTMNRIVLPRLSCLTVVLFRFS